MTNTFDAWLERVRTELQSINMPLDDWQKVWQFDFEAEYESGTDAGSAADKANRFWWHRQNKATKQDCRLTPDCWLPRGHESKCQSVS